MREANEAFLETFFGEGNQLPLAMALDTTKILGQWLEPWLDDLRAGTDFPLIVPRQLSDRRVIFYALAFSERQARALRDDLMAFVGPTHTTFRGREAVLDLADPVEKAVADIAAVVYRFEVRPPDAIQDVRANLLLMHELWHQRPELEAPTWRATGRIVRDFEMALEAKNHAEADAAIAELRNKGRLNAANLLFLNIRKLAAFERWEAILDLEELSTVVQARRPHLVTRDLIRSIYALELEGFERQGDAHGALKHFREALLPRYSPLFGSRGGLATAEVLKTFMLVTASADPQRPLLRDELLRAGQDLPETDQAWLHNLSQLVTEPAPDVEEPLQAAVESVTRGAFEEALEFLEPLEPGRERAELLIRCAYEINTLAAKGIAIAAVQALESPDKEAVLSSRWYRTQWEELTIGDEDEPPPSDWVKWARRLMDSGDWPEATAIAAQGAEEWELKHYTKNPERVADVADLLSGIPEGASQEALRQSLPHLVRFFTGEADAPVLQPIRDVLFMQLVVDDQTSDSDLVIMLDLFEAMVRSGIDQKEYTEYTEYLRDVWERDGSPARLDWSLEALDLLIELPAGDASARLAFASLVMNSFQQWRRRASIYQWELLGSLCKDLDLAAEFGRLAPKVEAAPEEESDLRGRLKGMKVGIYTLTESVARRVKETLERMFDGATVVTNSDKVGTDRLKSLAREADIFLVATRSAKHAATEFIDAHRPTDAVTLRPTGKGSVSMLAALQESLPLSSLDS